MMKHLTPHELVEAIDGTLGRVRLGHVDDCEQCATALVDLRAAVADVQAGADVPEPSPLFWEHFSARVHEATSHEPVAGPDWGRLWRPALALGALGLVAFIGIRLMTAPAGLTPEAIVAEASDGAGAADSTVSTPTPVQIADPPRESVPVGGGGADLNGEPTEAAALSAEADAAWTEVADAAGQLEFVEVEALVPTESSTVLLVEDLSETELEEFARLLRAEMGGVR